MGREPPKSTGICMCPTPEKMRSISTFLGGCCPPDPPQHHGTVYMQTLLWSMTTKRYPCDEGSGGVWGRGSAP